MIHWRDLTKQGRIEAIRQVWYPGCSSAQIAAHFDGATRNSVIGIYHRFPNSLVDKPLVKRGLIDDIAAERRKKRRRAPVTFLFKDRTSKQLPEPEFIRTEQHLCGKPMLMLQANECRFSVNNASGEELHLFCARPSTGVYCDHHRGRAYKHDDIAHEKRVREAMERT